VSATAGWYADPSGTPGQLRWWDGTRWTDHVTPDPALAQPAGAPAATGAAAEEVSPPPPTGAPDTGRTGDAPWSGGGGPVGPAGSTAGGWGGQAPPPAWQVDTPVPSRSSGVRTGLIVAAVVGVLVLGLLAIFAFLVFWGGSGGMAELAEEWDVSFGQEWDWGGETVGLGSVGVGDEVSGEVPFDGGAEASFEVTEAGTYTFDVRGEGDFDAMVAVFGPDGEMLGENDDRDFDAPDSGNTFDPYLEIDLEPGEYRVAVRGWAGDSGTFTLAVDGD
jgi:hypothetical protein